MVSLYDVCGCLRERKRFQKCIMAKIILSEFLHFFGFLSLALIAVLAIRFFIVQPFLVRGESMVPTFHNFDYLFVERVSYYFRAPERGDVVVFRFPQNESDFFIKRIIASSGERVAIQNGVITIYAAGKKNPLILEEPLAFRSVPTQGDIDITLGGNEYFVLGDNRGASFDSRKWGALPMRDIVGRVLLRVWPLTGAEFFSAEEYPYRLVEPGNSSLEAEVWQRNFALLA